MKPPERLKQDAKRHARADEITKNLKKMPEIVEGYRKVRLHHHSTIFSIKHIISILIDIIRYQNFGSFIRRSLFK